METDVSAKTELVERLRPDFSPRVGDPDAAE
jgi:hypothetical protein